MKLASHTFVDPKLLQPSDSAARRRFLITNHNKLIRRMRKLSHGQHLQSTFIEPVDENSRCGTSACALGWAVIGGDIPGLQYVQFTYESKEEYEQKQVAMLPIVNGQFLHNEALSAIRNDRQPWQISAEYDIARFQNYIPILHAAALDVLNKNGLSVEENTGLLIWDIIGTAFFGKATHGYVFLNASLTTKEVIQRLEKRVRQLKNSKNTQ